MNRNFRKHKRTQSGVSLIEFLGVSGATIVFLFYILDGAAPLKRTNDVNGAITEITKLHNALDQYRIINGSAVGASFTILDNEDYDIGNLRLGVNVFGQQVSLVNSNGSGVNTPTTGAPMNIRIEYITIDNDQCLRVMRGIPKPFSFVNATCAPLGSNFALTIDYR